MTVALRSDRTIRKVAAALGVAAAVVVTTGAAAPSAVSSAGAGVGFLPVSANASTYSSADFIQLESLYGRGYVAPQTEADKGAATSGDTLVKPAGATTSDRTIRTVSTQASGLCLDPTRTNGEGDITLTSCRNDPKQGFYKQLLYASGSTLMYWFRYAGNPDLCLTGVDVRNGSMDISLRTCGSYGRTQIWFPIQTNRGLAIGTVEYAPDGAAHGFCLDASKPYATYCGGNDGFKTPHYWGLRSGRFGS